MLGESWMDNKQRLLERRVNHLLLGETITVNGVSIERYSERGYCVWKQKQFKRVITAQGRPSDALKAEVIDYALSLMQAPVQVDLHQHVINKALARHRGRKGRG